MATKTIQLKDIGEVALHKRNGAKSIRLKVDERGKVTVTMPTYMPYIFAEQFVYKHREWLDTERSRRSVVLSDGLRVGRVHILRFVKDASAKQPIARVTASQVIVKFAGEIHDEEVQTAAKNAATRALRREALRFLPKRLADIAMVEGYDYNGVSIKQLRGRWGSCDQTKHITLNLYLMQLPIECIDYVIYHELAHTRALHHGPDFWTELEQHLPNARAMKAQMKQYQPTVPAARR